jgi:flagellar L-ring protein precursor FlgH
MSSPRLRGLLLAPFSIAAVTVVLAQTADTSARSFYADRRAAVVGDQLTVIVTEFSTVQATAQTSTNKSDAAKASVLLPNTTTRAVAANIDGSFSGGGQIERSDKVAAKLAVTVTGVDSNGNLTVAGEQDIEVNNERQRIRLQGFVRAEDIAPDNTIPSWRVGGAHIEFTGKGLLAKKQSPGLLTRLLSWFWE